MPVLGKKVIDSHKYSKGKVAIVEMSDTMYAVVVADEKETVIASRNFPFTENCKKEILKSCRSYYKFAKDCCCKKQLELLFEDAD